MIFRSDENNNDEIQVGVMARIREKYCDRCDEPALLLYRVRVDESMAWRFVCDRCWPVVQENNLHYAYGGTWKARKRH